VLKPVSKPIETGLDLRLVKKEANSVVNELALVVKAYQDDSNDEAVRSSIINHAKQATDAEKVVSEPFIYRAFLLSPAQFKEINSGSTIKLRAGGFSGWTTDKKYALEFFEINEDGLDLLQVQIVIKKHVDTNYVLVNVNTILDNHKLSDYYEFEQEILMFNKGPYLEVALKDIIIIEV
jgi:hypothetical protein